MILERYQDLGHFLLGTGSGKLFGVLPQRDHAKVLLNINYFSHLPSHTISTPEGGGGALFCHQSAGCGLGW